MKGTATFYAPPITDKHLAEWKDLIPTTPQEMQSALMQLHTLVSLHLQKYTFAPPIRSDLDWYGVMFERLDPITQKPLRDMAFHLLFFGNEFVAGREPRTTDKIAI